jgi:SAM-dependent methyltransferase
LRMTEGRPKAEEWRAEHARLSTTQQHLLYPAETLVRLFKGAYIPHMPKSFDGLRACDVSCGSGNNAFFLHDLGLSVFATEIDEGICIDVRRRAESSGRNIDVRVGTNRDLPFDDDFFDFLVSWNVIHYERSEQELRRGIEEYARVLRPGGILVLSTTGPDHKILAGARTVGSHLYEIGRTDDFRQGERFFYFDAPNYLHFYFDGAFDQVMVGRIHDKLFTETLDWWLVTGRKPM